MSRIADFLQSFFPSQEGRVLCLGLDASGRTTWLYAQKLGEIVTTIPTIGFNVESVAKDGVDVTFWDVGGCDKIRPLWRHYFQNTDGVMLFVDSNDRERIQEVRDEFNRLLSEEELRDAFCLVIASKQASLSLAHMHDLPNVMSLAEIRDALDLPRLMKDRHWVLMPTRLPVDKQELDGHMDWLVASIRAERNQKLEDYSLDVWDHRTHLRLAWLYLTRHGRREGLARIHSAIQSFIANSPVTKRKTGTTYHETMTYFWAHMVHFCIASMKAPQQQGKEPDFKTFLLFNPLLTNGGLFLHYYSKDLMLKNPEARKQVVLPDKRPLPSLVTSVESIKQLQQNQARYGKKPAAGSGPAGPATAVTAAAPPIALSDDEFLQRFLGRGLDRWSHATMLRAVYCCLRAHGRRHGGKLALDALAALQGEHAHTTLNYFWLTMLTHTLAAEHSAALFADRPAPPPLRKAPKRVEEEEGAGGQGKVAEAPSRQEPEPTSALPEWSALLGSGSYASVRLQELVADESRYLAHYNKKTIFSDAAAAGFVPPDKKPLPTTV
eukprot:XP_001690802.1 ARF-like GTPase ARLP2, atypical [Chlamydomonas reinhardtii]